MGFHCAIFRAAGFFSTLSPMQAVAPPPGGQRTSLTPSSAVALAASGERKPSKRLHPLCQKESAVTAARSASRCPPTGRATNIADPLVRRGPGRERRTKTEQALASIVSKGKRRDRSPPA